MSDQPPRQPRRPRPPKEYQRFKVTYDLTRDLADAIFAVAVQLKCSQSDVAVHLLVEGLTRFYNHELDLLARRKRHSYSLRFAFKLPLPALPPLPPDIASDWTEETSAWEGQGE